MSEFKDILSLYNYLEESTLDCRDYRTIADLFRGIIEIDKDNKSKAQWETSFFNFVARDGEILPLSQFTDEKGNIITYPDLSKFDEQAFNYLLDRISLTKNPLLKSRYAHILWKSPKKHGNYAQIAIDSYLRLAEIAEEKDLLKPEEHYGFYELELIKNAYFIARQINDKIRLKLMKSKIKSLIFHFNSKSVSAFNLRITLVELMLDQRDVFNKDDFVALNQVCLETARSLIDKGDTIRVVDLLRLGERIDEILSEKTADWELSIAEYHEQLMNNNLKEPMIAQRFCLNSINSYKKLKNQAKTDELSIKYINLTSSLKLESLEYSIDRKDYVESCRKLAKDITENNFPHDIIGYLMLNKDLLPTYDNLEKQVKQQMKDFPLQNLFPPLLLDQNGHPTQNVTQEGLVYYHIIENYKTYLEVYSEIKIAFIFIEAVKSRKLSLASLFDFFNNYSWFSTNISKQLPNEKILEYNWLSLLAPSLNEYFLEIDYFLYSGNYPNMILAIDSLTLKLEGLIRDFCRLIDIPTCTIRSDKAGNIVEEKNINALLHESKLEQVLGKDDLLFLKFLLIEKGGYYLRHKVAHSLMTYSEYGMDHMHLIILALLRLGKYNFKPK